MINWEKQKDKFKKRIDEVLKNKDQGSHGIVHMARIGGPYEGCFHEWQMLFFCPNSEGEFILKENFWNGWHKDLAKKGCSMDSVESVCDDYEWDSFFALLDDYELNEHVPDGVFYELCMLSANYKEIRPFTWKCCICGELTNAPPLGYCSERYLGGVTVVAEEPYCDNCIDYYEEEWY